MCLKLRKTSVCAKIYRYFEMKQYQYIFFVIGFYTKSTNSEVILKYVYKMERFVCSVHLNLNFSELE